MTKPICRHCHKPLRKYTIKWNSKWNNTNEEKEEPKIGTKTTWGIVIQIIRKNISEQFGTAISYWTGQWGYLGRGNFCTLKCGYSFAMNHVNKK